MEFAKLSNEELKKKALEANAEDNEKYITELLIEIIRRTAKTE